MINEKLTIRPTGGNYYTIEYLDDVTDVKRDVKPGFSTEKLSAIVAREPHNMAARLALAEALTFDKQHEKACQVRFAGCNMLLDMLPDDEDIILEWEADPINRDAVELFYASGLDHYMHGDYEYAAGLFEMALMLDEEDHFSATLPLAYCYVALEEWELLEETLLDVADGSLDAIVLGAWADFRRGTDRKPKERLARLAPEMLAEFMATDHPVDETFVMDIESQRPSKKAQARELYLRTEGIWHTFPDFIAALG